MSVVGPHARDVEILEGEPVVGLDQLAGDLVQEMSADIADMLMMPAQFRGGVVAVSRLFLFAGQRSCQVALPLHAAG